MVSRMVIYNRCIGGRVMYPNLCLSTCSRGYWSYTSDSHIIRIYVYGIILRDVGKETVATNCVCYLQWTTLVPDLTRCLHLLLHT